MEGFLQQLVKGWSNRDINRRLIILGRIYDLPATAREDFYYWRIHKSDDSQPMWTLPSDDSKKGRIHYRLDAYDTNGDTYVRTIAYGDGGQWDKVQQLLEPLSVH